MYARLVLLNWKATKAVVILRAIRSASVRCWSILRANLQFKFLLIFLASIFIFEWPKGFWLLAENIDVKKKWIVNCNLEFILGFYTTGVLKKLFCICLNCYMPVWLALWPLLKTARPLSVCKLASSLQVMHLMNKVQRELAFIWACRLHKVFAT